GLGIEHFAVGNLSGQLDHRQFRARCDVDRRVIEAVHSVQLGIVRNRGYAGQVREVGGNERGQREYDLLARLQPTRKLLFVTEVDVREIDLIQAGQTDVLNPEFIVEE